MHLIKIHTVNYFHQVLLQINVNLPQWRQEMELTIAKEKIRENWDIWVKMSSLRLPIKQLP